MTEQKEFLESLSVIAESDDDELEPQSLVFEDDEATANVEPIATQEEPDDLDEQIENEVAVTSEQVHSRFAGRAEVAE